MLRFLPDSLFGRLFMATCVPIVVMLATSYALVQRDRQLLANRLGGASNTVNRILSGVRQLAPLEAASRAEAIKQVNAEFVASQVAQTGGTAALALATAAATAASSRTVRAALDDFYLEPLAAALDRGCSATVADGTTMPPGFVDLARPPGVSYAAFRAAQEALSLPRTAAPGAASVAGASSSAAPAAGRPSRGLYDIAVTCAGHAPLHFRVPAPPDLPDTDTGLSWRLLLLTGVLGVVLFVVTRRLTAPLRELQRAADAVGRTQSVPPVREYGAMEIRQSLRAFNTMQDRLRRYLESRTRVLAAMSHDLRTPLTRLRLRAESVESPELRARLIGDIEEMDSLVNHSLDLFRGLNEQERLLEVDMTEFVADLARECRELGQPLTVSGSAQQPIAVRPLALKRALRNLVDNACKYGGGAELSLSDGAEVVIRVRDHGPGIPEAQLQAVMEPFSRLETSRNRDGGGVGLGLSIARDVAELHRGTLTLQNAPDGGLVATMTLPRP